MKIHTLRFNFIIILAGILIINSCQDDGNPVDAGKNKNFRQIGYLPVVQGHIRAVAIGGNYAFLADTVNGLRIVDISDHANPQEVTVYSTGNPPQRIFIGGNYLFVIGNQINGMNILDITTPLSPSFLKNLPNVREINDVQYVDSMLYIASGSMGLLVYDLSSINHPVFCSSFSEGGLCWAHGVEVVGARAFLADGFQAFRIMDISDPNMLRQVKIVPLAGPASDVCVAGDRAYICCGALGLFIYDVRNLKNVLELGSFVSDSTQINQIEIRGNVLYVSDLDHSFSLVDVSQPSSCRQFASYSGASNLYGFYAEGDYIYLAAGEEGMVVLEYK